MGTTSRPAPRLRDRTRHASAGGPRSTFRTIVIVVSSVAAALFLLCAVAVALYGTRLRDFGWTPARVDGSLVVGGVNPGGPADGVLQRGDEILAWDGDTRIARVSVVFFRRSVPPAADASYTLTI